MFITLVTMLLCMQIAYGNDAILLSDIKTLTFHQGAMTTGRRLPPIQQLVCTGGSGKYEAQKEVSVVQCYNQGTDGKNVQWKCESSLTNYKLGQVQVSCEGYANADDQYVLAGSCSLSYELIKLYPTYRSSTLRVKDSTDTYIATCFIGIFFTILICAVSRTVYINRTVPVVHGPPLVQPVVVQPSYYSGYQQPYYSGSYADGFVTGSIIGSNNYRTSNNPTVISTNASSSEHTSTSYGGTQNR